MINANLLPPAQKSEIAQSKKNTKAVRSLWYVIFLAAIVATLAITLWLYFSSALSAQESSLKSQDQALEKYGNLEQKAKKLSERLLAIKKIDSQTNKWSDVITEVQKVMPSGLYLTTVRIDASDKVRNQITGVAKSKQEVAALRDAMEKSPKFEFVDIESSATSDSRTSQVSTETFTISFSLSKGALE